MKYAFKKYVRVPKLQEKTVTKNGEVTADEGYDALYKVNVKTNGGATSSVSIVKNRVISGASVFATTTVTVGDIADG